MGGGGVSADLSKLGGGVIIYEMCKGEEDILLSVSFPRIPGRGRGRRMKNTRNDATSSNLKGKPMTKTIKGYIGYNRLQNMFPPQMKRAYTEHNCA